VQNEIFDYFWDVWLSPNHQGKVSRSCDVEIEGVTGSGPFRIQGVIEDRLGRSVGAADSYDQGSRQG
jgi:hypothetical protein